MSELAYARRIKETNKWDSLKNFSACKVIRVLSLHKCRKHHNSFVDNLQDIHIFHPSLEPLTLFLTQKMKSDAHK